MRYDFATQLAQGQQYEDRLDAIFNTWYVIRPASRSQQRLGIDRLWMRRDGYTKLYTVEYKADTLAGSTGNAFIETISVDDPRRPGWAEASRADMLIYLITDPQTIYMIWMRSLREQLDRWRAEYPFRWIDNGRYHTGGHLVPLDELERIAARVL